MGKPHKVIPQSACNFSMVFISHINCKTEKDVAIFFFILNNPKKKANAYSDKRLGQPPDQPTRSETGLR